MLDRKTTLLELYARLYNAFGPRHWWPADSGFEVAVGAILTQNTAWRNVTKAITNLKAAHLLAPRSLHDVPIRELAEAIRPAGYFNVKARRLKNFVDFLFEESDGDFERFFTKDLHALRDELLSVNGIGPETADSILLYAGNKPTFVVDAYTKRIFVRHKLISEEARYGELQALFMNNLEQDTTMFNEYHALLVYVGKHFCKSNPRCSQCPMDGL